MHLIYIRIITYHLLSYPYLQLVAHEIGHNLGMHHDHASRHQGKGCSKDENIMSYGSGPYKWSHCSVADFKAHYTYVTSSSSWCMDGTHVFEIFLLMNYTYYK